MILGIGTDMVEVERVKKACGREAFLKRIYTEEERRQAGGRTLPLAGNFAVKESVAKVFGTGFRGFGPSDIEVLRDDKGKPYVNLYGGALRRFQQMGFSQIHVSITNTKDWALGFAVGEGEGI